MLLHQTIKYYVDTWRQRVHGISSQKKRVHGIIESNVSPSFQICSAPGCCDCSCSQDQNLAESLGFRAWIGETRKRTPSSWDAGGKPLRALHLTDA
ncbi:hypothetical protein PVAP13_4NG286276 [Panicum virgatum]|uniref:Uncharacterized protein n=1 Tax=Panicum virgatum TaxID=38727 RepID=A0A8T0TAW1_PANVG|nr:hypothetical protein PVAP13_4NG286276 [Panicum virgatum]